MLGFSVLQLGQATLRFAILVVNAQPLSCERLMSHRWWYRNLVDSSCTTQRVTLHVRGTRQELDTCQGQLDTVQSSKMFRAYIIYINECQHFSMQQTHFLGRNRRSRHAIPMADFMLWGSAFLFLVAVVLRSRCIVQLRHAPEEMFTVSLDGLG